MFHSSTQLPQDTFYSSSQVDRCVRERLTHSLGAANEAEIRSLFSALTWKDESPFTLSGRVIKRPKAPELGPDANFRRIAEVRSACRNSPRVRLQAREISRFYSPFALRQRTEQMPNSVSYLQVPKRFTASRGHAQLEACSHLFRAGVAPVRITTPEGLESEETPTRSGCITRPSRFSLLSLSNNDANGAAITPPPLDRAGTACCGTFYESL
jgi:hypothetical protein